MRSTEPRQKHVIILNGSNPRMAPASVIAVTGPGQVHLMGRDRMGNYMYTGARPNWIYVLSPDPNSSPGCYDKRKDNSTTHILTVPHTINIKIKLHILYVPSSTDRDSILRDFIDNDVEITNELWVKNRFGVKISEAILVPESADFGISSLTDFNCGMHKQYVKRISSEDKDYIHIFLTKSINKGSTIDTKSMRAGWVCDYPQNYAVIAYGRSPTLLAHELGHVMGLNHCNESGSCQLRYQQNNIMHQYLSERQSLTVGQIICAHIDPNSIINQKLWRRGNVLNPSEDDFANCTPSLFPRLDFHDSFQDPPSMFTSNGFVVSHVAFTDCLNTIDSLQPEIIRIARRDPEATNIVRAISEGEYDKHIEETVLNELEHLHISKSFTEEIAENQQHLARRRATSILSNTR